MAVVKPPPRVVLHEARGDRLVGADRRTVHVRAGGVAPAVAVDVEGVEVLVHAHHVDGDALSAPCTDRRRVAGEAAPVDRVEQLREAGHLRREAVQEEDLLDVGRRRAPLAHDHRPEQAPQRVEGVVGAVVVVGPDTDGVGCRLPDVGELLARRHEAPGAREVGEVGAVVLGVVADPVRVHRDRLAQLAVEVGEVDHDHVADLGVERRAGHAGAAERLGKACAERLVDVGAQPAPPARRDAVLHPLVAPGRRDVPGHRACPDPVLAAPAAGLGVRGRELGAVDRVPARGSRARQRGGDGVHAGHVLGRADRHRVASDRAQQGARSPRGQEAAPVERGGLAHVSGRPSSRPRRAAPPGRPARSSRAGRPPSPRAGGRRGPS